jgi:RNA polymerase sigma factor (sigma-70 family)
VSLPPFQNFLDDHRDDVYRFLVASVGPVDADDCFQETFMAALRAYPRLRANSNLRAWVITIANRKALDALRSRKRRPTLRAEPPERVAAERDGFDPELWTAVRELPAKQQTAVLHRYVNDLPYADIARVMDCSPEAARRNVHEGLKTLRQQSGGRTK